LSDYGHDDDFVGVCHGVMAGIAPEARVIDITHGLPRHGVRAGALILRNTLSYMPAGIHLAVVDPEVGSQRRPVALRLADERILVGPDNGLLDLAARRFGGVVEAIDVARSPFRLEPVSATFHGRDIFAPVAARLAAGEPLGSAGDPIDPDTLAALDLPEPRHEDGAVIAHALAIDRFGNVALNVTREHLDACAIAPGEQVEIDVGPERYYARAARTFADARRGDLILYEDSYRNVALAISNGDAAALLAVRPGQELRIRVDVP
jgi:S-adenosyl-L-methionine hydrolase (adenosine-forming)